MKPRFFALSRRNWMLGGAVLALAAPRAGAQPIPPRAANEPIEQPAAPGPAAWMARAVEMQRRAEREGDQSFGAVVVRGTSIVGLGPSAVVTRGDPTAHAEIEAIRDAARRLGMRTLSGCVLYSTSRPCPMCEAAAAWAGIERMIHGAALTDAGAPRVARC